ncbi:FK506-binding protein [Phycisphaerales bacterium]|nr:FK506-binding protein [Phycisphaerales bacterium]
MRNGSLAVGVLIVGLAAVAARAQQEPDIQVPPKALEAMQKVIAERLAAKNAAARTPEWTSPEFEGIGRLLIGSWKSEGSPGVLLNVAHVFVPGVPNAMYCEIATDENSRQPYRQTLLTLRTVGGKPRLTTFEFRRPKGALGSANFAWAAPEVFPSVIGTDDLVATMMIDLSGSAGHYTGRSPHPYPTSLGGAVEMSSELDLAEGRIQFADRGFGPDGTQVWGPKGATMTAFTRHDLGLRVNRPGPPGLVSITFPTTLQGEPAKPGEQISLNYVGYLEDGKAFDTIYQSGTPFKYTQGWPLLPGWVQLNNDLQVGMVRRMFIPATLAYAAEGRRGQVPPNSNLIYDIEVMAVEPPPSQPGFEIKPVEGNPGGGPPPVKAQPVDPK